MYLVYILISGFSSSCGGPKGPNPEETIVRTCFIARRTPRLDGAYLRVWRVPRWTHGDPKILIEKSKEPPTTASGEPASTKRAARGSEQSSGSLDTSRGPWEDPMRISHRHQDSFKADFLSIRANAGSAGLRGTARSAPFRIPAVLEVAAATFRGEAVAESGQERRQPHRPTTQSRIDEGLSLTSWLTTVFTSHQLCYVPNRSKAYGVANQHTRRVKSKQT